MTCVGAVNDHTIQASVNFVSQMDLMLHKNFHRLLYLSLLKEMKCFPIGNKGVCQNISISLAYLGARTLLQLNLFFCRSSQFQSFEAVTIKTII